MNKVKISAIVTTYNEDKRLNECLSKLKFCEELVVVDLGSTDNSVKIAEEYATKLVRHKKVAQVEEILTEFVPTLKNNWVYITDPDEILDERLVAQMIEHIHRYSDAAIIRIPIHYYFKNKRLTYTIWGRNKYRHSLINRNKVVYRPRVHNGIIFKDKQAKVIDMKSKYSIRHYWADSYKDLFKKHLRYLEVEGKSRYEKGEKYSFRRKVLGSFKALINSLIKQRGIFGGYIGIFLSFFYCWYIWQANNSLKRYEERIK